MDKLTSCIIKEMAWMPFEFILKGICSIPSLVVDICVFIFFLPKILVNAIIEFISTITAEGVFVCIITGQFCIVWGVITCPIYLWLKANLILTDSYGNVIDNSLLAVFVAILLAMLFVSVVELVLVICFILWADAARERCLARFTKIQQQRGEIPVVNPPMKPYDTGILTSQSDVTGRKE